MERLDKGPATLVELCDQAIEGDDAVLRALALLVGAKLVTLGPGGYFRRTDR